MKRWFGLGMILAGALVFAIGVTAGDSESAEKGTCPLSKAVSGSSCSSKAVSKVAADVPKSCPVLQAGATQGKADCEKAKCDQAAQDCSKCPAANNCEKAVKTASADGPACSGEKAVKKAAADSCCAAKVEADSAARQVETELTASES